ncbi:MAG: DNA-binding response regulator [Rhizobiaceae bacterium]
MKKSNSEAILVDGTTDLCRQLLSCNRLNVVTYDDYLDDSNNSNGIGETTPATKKQPLVTLELGQTEEESQSVIETLRKGGFQSPILIIDESRVDNETSNGNGANHLFNGEKRLRFAVFPIYLRHKELAILELDESEYEIGSFLFKPSEKMLFDESGYEIRLTEKESELLHHLYNAENTAIPREELLERIWGYHPNARTHTVETHIYRLRLKLSAELFGKRMILTEKTGYRLAR